MKKNLMSLAVAASVAGVTATAQAAMYVNPENTGQVLLFPFYTAENNNETSMHIVNTTGKAKAVKVRFMEYANSQEVLDFNLYLSPEDHFSFTIFKNPNGDGGAIITRDNSCTVPALGDATAGVPGSTTTNDDGSITRIQPFLPYQYAADTAGNGISRSLVGHVEVIEMGVLNDNGTKKEWAKYATHDTKGVPADCAALVKSWSTGGTWKTTPADGITAAEGGLYGLSNVLNNNAASAYGIEPAAIESFWGTPAFNHSDPGSVLPSLASGDTSSIVSNGGAAYTMGFTSSTDAVSSLFMTKAVMNDVMLNPVLAGQTDWVVTFPTRRYYINGTAAVAPFTDIWNGKKSLAEACELITVEQWDREEAVTAPTVDTPIFSPAPPDPAAPPGSYLCYETNTLKTAADSSIGGTATSVAFPYAEGWQRISFAATGHKLTPASINGVTNSTGKAMDGLPAMGFAAFKYTNATSNYGFVSDHKTDVAGSAF
jgi:hypothetical protein